jgi:hypothetical protein
MQEEIDALLEKQAIVHLVPPLGPGFYSSVFVVPKKDGGWRPIINLKNLNNHIHSPHFKMENISNLKDIILPGDWMCKLDLKDAYLSVPVHKTHWRFLRFSWEREFYEFKTLPFGLTSAPYVFTKLLRPVASLLRQQGIRILIYLDDLLLMASDPVLLKDQTAHVITVLHSLGFVLNNKKCVTEPSQSISSFWASQWNRGG